MSKSIRQYLSQLVLALPIQKFESPNDEAYTSIEAPIRLILSGKSSELISNEDTLNLVLSPENRQLLSGSSLQDLVPALHAFTDNVVQSYTRAFANEEVAQIQLQLLAIGYLQTFIQVNFTGPGISFSSHDTFFPESNPETLQFESVSALNLEGQSAYDLVTDPLFLIIAALLFERLMGIQSSHSLIQKSADLSIEELIELTGNYTQATTSSENPIAASLQWWRSRLLQVHLSVLSEPPSVLTTVSSLLLNPSVPNNLAPSKDSNLEIQKNIQLVYYLECSRSGIHSSTETLSIPLLNKAKTLSNLDFILSGAKAKRTKFQTFHTSALIVLAKSMSTSIFDQEDDSESPENHNLDSDLLLERPQYESLDDLELQDEPNSKKLKLDPNSVDSDEQKEQVLLPIAYRQEDIPAHLKELDPNDQPPLNDIDNLQLLLRLTTLRQTSPSGNALVEEELVALVSRVLYTKSKKVNWTIFSRALWERSILETNKSRTIERGILQMTSLIEEIGLKIKTRIIPQVPGAYDDETSLISSRLRFIHQLPLMPQWSMDTKLAEKYMSLGVIRSAIEIYERLQLACEAALCHAACDNEKEAERIILERIASHPKDARAISILGDIKQDPALWEKAWEVGRYAKSRASLARYYYSPPPSSGLTKDLNLTIKYMNDCLSINPLSYENWFFYGCCGLESAQYELASEAFTRCVSLDDNNSHAWSNLGSALLKLDKTRPAFNALKRAIRSAGENKKSWRIYENYMIVAVRLNEWNDVVIAAKELIDIRRGSEGEGSIDIPIVEKLVEILVSTEYPKVEDDGTDGRLTHFQSSCVDLICNVLPSVITTSSRCWRIVARVELWRKKPWNSLECHEKAYRALVHRSELEFQESAWNDAVDSCSDLIGAYESLGELPGRLGAGDLVCSDWKYKSRTTIRSLMSKGKDMWEDSEGWNRLQELKQDVSN